MNTAQYKLYRRRWYMLFVFFMLSSWNYVIAFTFAPISSSASTHYDREGYMVPFAVMYFWLYVVAAVPTSFLIDRMGLRYAVVLGATLQALGAWVRVSFYGLNENFTKDDAYTMALIGQFLVALTQGVWINPPPLFAAVWFGSSEREWVVTLLCSANLLGIMAAYVISPLIVHNSIFSICESSSIYEDLSKSDCQVQTVLLFVAIVACFLALFTWLFFPDRPPSPPSYIAELQLRQWLEQESNKLRGTFSEAMDAIGRAPHLMSTPLLTGHASLQNTTSSKSSSVSDTVTTTTSSISEQREQRTGSLRRPVLTGSALIKSQTSASTYKPAVHGLLASNVILDPAVQKALAGLLPLCGSALDNRMQASLYQVLRHELGAIRTLLKVPGVIRPLVAFSVIQCLANDYAISLSSQLMPLVEMNYFKPEFVMVCGVGLIALVLLGSLLGGVFIERYPRNYRSILLTSFGICMVVEAVFSIYIAHEVKQSQPNISASGEDAIAGEDGPAYNKDSGVYVILLLCLLGAAVGPVMPIAVDCASECAYPRSESEFLFIFIFCGNVFSAITIPCLESLRRFLDGPLW